MEALHHPVQANDPDHVPAIAREIDFPVVHSVELMNGARELRIRHGVSLYRLRVTASGKLILTK